MKKMVDLLLLNLCGRSVSVQNALFLVKEVSDWVMTKSCGDAVVELIEKLYKL